MKFEKIYLDGKYLKELEHKIKDLGEDSDYEKFDAIKLKLEKSERLSSIEFAKHCFYVILAGGFSQKTAKQKHTEIVNTILNDKCEFETLFNIFRNKNKINAIIKIWENRDDYSNNYYNLNLLEDKLKYLSKLPHIGKITANHLARNLGENMVKYDIWIQRLGVCTYGTEYDVGLIGFPLNENVKSLCDLMFCNLKQETGYPIGYIDVILWKACQIGLIFKDLKK